MNASAVIDAMMRADTERQREWARRTLRTRIAAIFSLDVAVDAARGEKK